MMMRPASLESQSAVAYSVRGYSMGAIRDGWWAFTHGLKGRPNDDLIDELCIARTRSGRTLLRFLRKGRMPGTWDLVSVTGDPQLDQELEWAERVVWLEPHRVTHTEIDDLQKLATVE